MPATAGTQPKKRAHVRLPRIEVSAKRRLTVTKIQAVAGPLTPDIHVFLCGPTALVEDLTTGLRRHGIPWDHLHAEHFAFR